MKGALLGGFALVTLLACIALTVALCFPSLWPTGTVAAVSTAAPPSPAHPTPSAPPHASLAPVPTAGPAPTNTTEAPR